MIVMYFVFDFYSLMFDPHPGTRVKGEGGFLQNTRVNVILAIILALPNFFGRELFLTTTQS